MDGVWLHSQGWKCTTRPWELVAIEGNSAPDRPSRSEWADSFILAVDEQQGEALMRNGPLRVIPLGGMGGIGKNCNVIETDDDILIVDAGIQFPSEDMLGVDVVIPDFQYLEERRDKIRGIVITHGHEDHIGGLPYLLERVSAPIYAPPLARGLIEGKLNANALKNTTLHTITDGQEIVLGPFSVTPFHVNHSIPDSVGLAIRTPMGLIVHTGDFKIDHTPLEGRPTDMGAMARLSNEGVVLLMSDSTNAESPGYTPSESQLRDVFDQVFSRAEGRVIVATFASLLSRVQLVIETAVRHGRKVAIAGRSMEQNVEIAEKLGYIRFPENSRVQVSQINNLPDNEVVIMATGSQGEPNSALARMGAGRFRYAKIREGDTVILSSTAIPGNETAIYRNVDNLYRRGAQVVYGRQAGLHVSGHAAQEELKMMLNLLRPTYFVPLHGAYRMLHQHARLAQELGMPHENIFVLDNGDVLELMPEGARLGEPVPAEGILVDGSLVGDVGRSLLRDRMTLAQDGIVVVKVTIDAQTGTILREPEIISHGFVYVPEAQELLQAGEEAISEVIQSYQGNGSGYEPEKVSMLIERRLGNFFYNETRRRPVVVSVVSTR
jgi:ribonuclease J